MIRLRGCNTGLQSARPPSLHRGATGLAARPPAASTALLVTKSFILAPPIGWTGRLWSTYINLRLEYIREEYIPKERAFCPREESKAACVHSRVWGMRHRADSELG